MVSFAPQLTSTMHSIPAFCATFSSSNSTSPAQLIRSFQPSSTFASSFATFSSPSTPAAFQLSSVPLFNFSSQPPHVAASTDARYHSAVFDFTMPATLTMSMTLPNSVQLPAAADVVDAEPLQSPEAMVVDAAYTTQHEEARDSVSSVSLFTPPLSTSLLSRSLHLTFTATQWASLAQFAPVTPLPTLDREQKG